MSNTVETFSEKALGIRLNPRQREMATALQRVVEGQCPRLLIMAPPRAGLTTMIGEALPAYILAHKPDAQVGYCTYSLQQGAHVAHSVAGDLAAVRLSAAYSGGSAHPRTNLLHEDGLFLPFLVGAGLMGRAFDLFVLDTPMLNPEPDEQALDAFTAWYSANLTTRLIAGGAVVVGLPATQRALARRLLDGGEAAGAPWGTLYLEPD